ncbi:MAG: YARHG domain-containing protein [Candidatus Sericytochromatia bacterium]|nr:YARHG domain-containing protein [Candidatus Sericytochromatia bacterium]
MKKILFATLFLNLISLPTWAVEYSGQGKLAQKHYPVLKKIVCSPAHFGGIGKDCDLDRVRIIGVWAWVSWSGGEAGGNSLLKLSGSSWKHVTGGGGAMNAENAIQVGLTKAQAEMLVPSFGLDIARSSEKIIASEIDYLSEWDLMVARNTIYAIHGRIFQHKPLQDYFASFPWYKPNPKYHDGLLSALEKYNANVILQLEKKKGYM